MASSADDTTDQVASNDQTDIQTTDKTEKIVTQEDDNNNDADANANVDVDVNTSTADDNNKTDQDKEKTQEKEPQKANNNDNDKESKDDEKTDSNETDTEWTLYYWRGMGARATPLRFLMALADIDWSEPMQDASKDQMEVCKKIKGGDIDGYPNFAMPILTRQLKDNEKLFVLSQTIAIASYISEEFDLMPGNGVDKAHALQIVLTCYDVIQEAWKLIKIGWQSRRLPKFLQVLENNLKENKNGTEWYFGDKVSIADVFVADVMRRFRGVLGNSNYDKLESFALLKDHLKRFESLEKIENLMKSDKFYEGKKENWSR